TRATSVVFMAGVLSLQKRSIFIGDGGDIGIHLMAIYLVLTRCARVWSLDARRGARNAVRVAEGGRPAPDRVGPALWTVLGVVLLPATLMGGLGGTWWLPVLLWILWLGNGAWWTLNRLPSAREPRLLLDVLANLAHHA
ncbi:HTTM domain-containing protein, partial [Streptomyces sp. SID13031]|nr:HTTM domain-containing protein [Streptomyces sp. SID13031]